MAQWPYLTCGYHTGQQRQNISITAESSIGQHWSKEKRRKEKSSVHRILSTTNNEEFEVENGALKETGEEMEKPER